MENLNEKLEAQLKEINLLVNKSNRSLYKFQDLPSGTINLSKSKGCLQYYYVEKNSSSKKYMKASDKKLVKRLIQRDYELAINNKLKDLQKRLSKFLNSYDIDELDRIYENMIEGRKIFINPFIQTEEDFIKEWYEANQGLQNPYPEEGMYTTNRGELVRSKSERIIADLLEKYGIPYQYEPILELGNNTIYPDFVVLNLRTRKTIYWEHLGLVSDIEYAAKNLRKIQYYEKNGYLLGRDLITTIESVDFPMDIRLVEQKIKEFLL